MNFHIRAGSTAASGSILNIDGTASVSSTATVTVDVAHAGQFVVSVNSVATPTIVGLHAGFVDIVVSSTATVAATGVSSGDNKLLLESGDFVLLETGDRVLLEA